MFRLKKIQIDGYKNLAGDYDFSNNKGVTSKSVWIRHRSSLV